MRTTPSWTSRLIGLVCGALSGGAVVIPVVRTAEGGQWPVTAIGTLGAVVIAVAIGTWVEQLAP